MARGGVGSWDLRPRLSHGVALRLKQSGQELRFENVFRVVLDFVFIQEADVFPFKRLLGVMCSLVADVRLHNLYHRLTHRKRTVPALPLKPPGKFSLFVDPFRCIGFEELNGFRNSKLGMNP